ncbi:hypothetical protein NOR_05149 [Metarhizium rileyi]|uniref:Uncharacterized protein n=1 Tax=Metarhizium rileyi (strain RCEF 4871) TaxID=1649241 RepID=A0A167CW27_METRR|nr:hypothetical protein NOR_05149 [Metarhizium rileyi RCEF 4871]TWU73369.1 hypothetical protein ED733_001176 [Metarhizium rileyi]
MLWKAVVVPLILDARQVIASSRKDSQSICDYYAEKRYGENNITTQLHLMQGIVAYAYAGGQSLPHPNENSTGIFNKGKFNDQQVFLRSWFDGSKAISNVNGHPAKVNWLDGGGLEPLYAFLNGSTDTAEIRPSSNQDILFSHWYVTFGKVYKCTNASQFVAKEYAPFTPAYVHKFMDLDQTQVAYFIDQLILASKYYGFSDSDAQQLAANMNTKYNNKCSPPDATGQLNSVCFASDCPRAVPEQDCKAYESIEQYGFKAATPTGTATGVVPTYSAATSSAADSPGAGADGGSSSRLSAGAIAGIVIGGAVVVLMAVGMWLYFRRQQQQSKAAETPAVTQNQMSEGGSTVLPAQSMYSSNTHESYYGRGPHDSYVVSTIGSPGSPPPTWEQSKWSPPQELATESPSPPPGGPQSNNQWEQMHQIAEMESPDPPPGWSQTAKQ